MAPVKFMQFQSHWFEAKDSRPAAYRIFALDFDGRLWSAYFERVGSTVKLDEDGWELLPNPEG